MSTPKSRAPSTIDIGEEHTITAGGATLDSVGQRIRARMFGGDEPEPDQVDRFRLERLLGAGGMGTVYEAWDEQLQRRVALKFLRSVAKSETGEKRFYREAQGLARISHPNVVPVYDVGRWKDKVWIAMEYVPGKTLGRWASEATRTPSEIVRHWAAAGRGLAGIHSAGLVHRDIKPANVLLGDDGRVRIVDFGLVKVSDTIDDLSFGASGQAPSSDGPSSGGFTTQDSLSESLTDCDSFVGTPAYAAPEHWDRRWVDSRSDQYSFCVALWEALVGTRPSRRERERGGVVQLPKDKRLPKRLYRALCRGLALDPQERFPDMLSLVDALEPPRRRWIAPVVAAGVTGVLGVSGAMALIPAPELMQADPCAASGDGIDEVWTARRKEVLAERLELHVAAQAEKFLGDWAEGWRRAARESCEDVHVRHLYSSDTLDRRTPCLIQSLDGFEALLNAIEEGGVGSSHELVRWFGALDDPQECLVEDALRRDSSAPPAEHAEELQRLRRQLIRVSIEEEDGYDARMAKAEEIQLRARELEWRPLEAEASLVLAGFFKAIYENERARAETGRALDLAGTIGDTELEAQAWGELLHYAWSDFDIEAADWALARERGLFVDGAPTLRQRARLEFHQGQLFNLKSDYAEGEIHLRESISLYSELGSAWSWEQAKVLRVLAAGLHSQDRGPEALESLELAARLETELVLGESPKEKTTTSKKLLDESFSLYGAGKIAEARTRAEAGLEAAIMERGPRGMRVARFHVVAAAACDRLGDLDCVREHAEQADAISLVAGGPKHSLRVDVLSTLGIVAFREERYTSAKNIYQEALTLAEERTGKDSISTADAERNLAETLFVVEEYTEAAFLIEHARSVYAEHLDADHSKIVKSELLSGELDLLRGKTEAGCRTLGRAMEKDLEEGQRSRIFELMESCSTK